MEQIKKTHAWDSWYFFKAPAAMYEARRKARMAWLEIRHRDDDSEATKAYKDAKSKEAFELYRHGDWFFELRDRFTLHPVVEHLVKAYRPASWSQLLLEHPHISETDPNRLAYTRDEAAGKADRQTITSVGKYIKRHWPSLPDHVLRDAAALYVPDQIEYGTGIQFLIRGIEFGPRSCMQSGYGSIPFRDMNHQQLKRWLGNPEDNDEPQWDRHPYSVYVPEYGWGMVIRTSEGQVLGRCLTWTDPDDASRKVFVRSYARNKGGDLSQSGSDHIIEAWLKERGFVKRDGWPHGARFAMLSHPSGDYMMPYLDGGGPSDRRVSDGYDVERKVSYFYRDPSGDYLCDNTDGSATHEDDKDDEDDENMTSCEDCGDRVHVDDTTSVGHNGERYVCQHCLDNHYTYVRGTTRWGMETYYVHDDDAASVYESWEDERRGSAEYMIDTDNVPSGITEVDGNGYYANLDNLVCCTDGEYRFHDDPNVVELADECPDTGERYAHKADAWEDGDGNWYSDQTDWVLVNGNKYAEDDCWKCEGTGLWYREDDNYVEDEDGNKYAPDFFDRVSSDAEWGDDVMYDTRVDQEMEPLDLLHYTRRELDFFELDIKPISLTPTPPTVNPTGWEHPGQTPESVADLLAAAKAVLTEAFALAA